MNPKSGTVIYIEYRKEGELSIKFTGVLQCLRNAYGVLTIKILICILKTKLWKFDT